MTRSEGQSSRPDVVWGIRSTAGVEGPAKKFALVAGLGYLVGGVIGFFFTGFGNFTEMTGRSLFGLFMVTPFHNVVHMGVGALWLLAAFTLTSPATEGLNFAIGAFYLLAAALGYLGFLGFLGIRTGLDPDNFLHLVTGLVTLLFAGLVPSRDRSYA